MNVTFIFEYYSIYKNIIQEFSALLSNGYIFVTIPQKSAYFTSPEKYDIVISTGAESARNNFKEAFIMSEMLNRVAEFGSANSACGSADPKPSACGAADPKPSACGSACGAADPDKK